MLFLLPDSSRPAVKEFSSEWPSRCEIVRTSSNPDYFHVMVNGQRYEVWLNKDRMSRERDTGL